MASPPPQRIARVRWEAPDPRHINADLLAALCEPCRLAFGHVDLVRSKNRNALESLGYPLPGWDFDTAVGRHEAVMDWARMLAYVTGTVEQELLARNEY